MIQPESIVLPGEIICSSKTCWGPRGCVGGVGERGGGEGKGGREGKCHDHWNEAERLGAYTQHPAPEKLSISSLPELFEPKGKTNKQNKTAELARGAVVCWASVCERRAGAQTLEVMLTRHCTERSPGSHTLPPCAVFCTQGTAFLIPCLRGPHSASHLLHFALTITLPPLPPGT